jgi:hypothetical protein
VNTNETSFGDEAEAFLDVSAITNAIDYLESAAHFLERSDSFKWKWVAIATHHALYAFSIVSLARNNTDLVISHPRDDQGTAFKQDRTKKYKSQRAYLDNRKAAYRIEWIETNEQPEVLNDPGDDFVFPTGRLISSWTALARVQDDFFMCGRVDIRPIAIPDEDVKAIQWLGLDVRNMLIHFVPANWGISIEGIRCGCLAAIKVIESLVFESNAIYPADEDTRSRIKLAIARLRIDLAAQGN